MKDLKEKAFISVIVYCHNAASTIGSVLISLDKWFCSRFENYEIITVNDASSDSTDEEIKKISGRLQRDLTVVNLAWKHGPDAGVLAGIDLAIGDFLIGIEVDKMDYNLDLLCDLFHTAEQGYDIVSASPLQSKSGIETILYRLFNRLSYLSFDISNETVRIASRRAVNGILAMNERVIHRGILYQWSGFPKKTISYERSISGTSTKSPLREKIRLALDVIVSYSNVGTDLSVILAAFFFLLSGLLGLYALIMYFSPQSVVPGWTTTMLFMSICFSGIFIVLGLQGRYISSILLEIKRRPTYTVRSIERFTHQREGNN